MCFSHIRIKNICSKLALVEKCIFEIAKNGNWLETCYEKWGIHIDILVKKKYLKHNFLDFFITIGVNLMISREKHVTKNLLSRDPSMSESQRPSVYVWLEQIVMSSVSGLVSFPASCLTKYSNFQSHGAGGSTLIGFFNLILLPKELFSFSE